MSKKLLAVVALGALLKANGPGSTIKTVSPGNDISSDASIEFFDNLKSEMLGKPGFSDHDFIVAAEAAQNAFTNGASYKEFIDIDGKIHFDFIPADLKEELNPNSDIAKIEELINNLLTFINDNIAGLREMSPLQQVKTLLQLSGLLSCLMQIGKIIKATCSGLFHFGKLSVGFFKKIYKSISALNTGPVPTALNDVYDQIEIKSDAISDDMSMNEAIYIIKDSVSADSLRLLGMDPQNVLDASAEMPTVLPSYAEKRDDFYDPSKNEKKEAYSLGYGGKRTKRRKRQMKTKTKTFRKRKSKSLRKRKLRKTRK